MNGCLPALELHQFQPINTPNANVAIGSTKYWRSSDLAKYQVLFRL